MADTYVLPVDPWESPEAYAAYRAGYPTDTVVLPSSSHAGYPVERAVNRSANVGRTRVETDSAMEPQSPVAEPPGSEIARLLAELVEINEQIVLCHPDGPDAGQRQVNTGLAKLFADAERQ